MPRPVTHQHVCRTARTILGLNQKELAKRVGIAAITLNKFENGEASVSRQIAVKIAAELGLPVDRILKNRKPEKVTMADFIDQQVVDYEKQLDTATHHIAAMVREVLKLGYRKKKFGLVKLAIEDNLGQIAQGLGNFKFDGTNLKPFARSASKPKQLLA